MSENFWNNTSSRVKKSSAAVATFFSNLNPKKLSNIVQSLSHQTVQKNNKNSLQTEITMEINRQMDLGKPDSAAFLDNDPTSCADSAYSSGADILIHQHILGDTALERSLPWKRDATNTAVTLSALGISEAPQLACEPVIPGVPAVSKCCQDVLDTAHLMTPASDSARGSSVGCTDLLCCPPAHESGKLESSPAYGPHLFTCEAVFSRSSSHDLPTVREEDQDSLGFVDEHAQEASEFLRPVYIPPPPWRKTSITSNSEPASSFLDAKPSVDSYEPLPSISSLPVLSESLRETAANVPGSSQSCISVEPVNFCNDPSGLLAHRKTPDITTTCPADDMSECSSMRPWLMNGPVSPIRSPMCSVMFSFSETDSASRRTERLCVTNSRTDISRQSVRKRRSSLQYNWQSTELDGPCLPGPGLEREVDDDDDGVLKSTNDRICQWLHDTKAHQGCLAAKREFSNEDQGKIALPPPELKPLSRSCPDLTSANENCLEF